MAWGRVQSVLLGLLLLDGTIGHLHCFKDRWIYRLKSEDTRAADSKQIGNIVRSADNLASCSTKCQIAEGCETVAFDKEDFKCQLISSPVLSPAEVTSDSSDDAAGYSLFEPDCSDGSRGGWRLLFKAGRNTGRGLWDDFTSTENFNEDRLEAKGLDNLALYKSPELDLSPFSGFVDLEVRLYSSLGEELFALRFDAVGKDKTTFFTLDNIRFHPWTEDWGVSPPGVFRAVKLADEMQADDPADMSFAIWSPGSGSPAADEGGWMTVLESDPGWDGITIRTPSFLYALPGGPKVANWESALRDGTAEVASAFAIFAR